MHQSGLLLSSAAVLSFVGAAVAQAMEEVSVESRLEDASKIWGRSAIVALQVLPPVFGQIVFLSPLVTINNVRAKMTTGDLPLLPYSMMACSGYLWMVYGLLRHDTTIIVANVSPLVLGLYYCFVYLRFRAPTVDVLQPLALSFAAAVMVSYFWLVMQPAAAANAIGTTGCFVVAAMFGGPLAVVHKVWIEQSTASLPFPMAVATTLNCFAWLLYGLVIADFYVYAPNVLGLVSGILQLLLFAMFGFAPPATKVG
ncbi:Sugar transporter SWEET1 [Diplonema papillatum]|nr:Sugar transporter SWEET1 [Diplonema papillatum]